MMHLPARAVVSAIAVAALAAAPAVAAQPPAAPPSQLVCDTGFAVVTINNGRAFLDLDSKGVVVVVLSLGQAYEKDGKYIKFNRDGRTVTFRDGGNGKFVTERCRNA
ncbi:hypothetical protein ACFXOM_16985 [Streptomyces sp. NPDC059169]|uniref:hypothetical protein n=1 Tax=unclassified Streptomyces TaxID=2593676 RepID=UPI0036CEBCCA